MLRNESPQLRHNKRRAPEVTVYNDSDVNLLHSLEFYRQDILSHGSLAQWRKRRARNTSNAYQ